jgi:hypothetical protein
MKTFAFPHVMKSSAFEGVEILAKIIAVSGKKVAGRSIFPVQKCMHGMFGCMSDRLVPDAGMDTSPNRDVQFHVFHNISEPLSRRA